MVPEVLTSGACECDNICFVYLSKFFEMEPCYAAQDGLKLAVILLPQFSQCWDIGVPYHVGNSQNWEAGLE